MVRIALFGTAVVLAVVVSILLWYVALPVMGPYASTRIPDGCSTARRYGTETLLAKDSAATVVRTVDTSSQPPTTDVLLLDNRSGDVIRTLVLPSDIAGAAMYRGVAYIFNDKIGYFLDESTGRRVHYLIESDNYRGVYHGRSGSYIQTDFIFSALGRSGFLGRIHLRLHSVAFGCYFP